MLSVWYLVSCRYRRRQAHERREAEKFFYGDTLSPAKDSCPSLDPTEYSYSTSKSSNTNTASVNEDEQNVSRSSVEAPRFRDVYTIIDELVGNGANDDVLPTPLGALRPPWDQRTQDEGSEQTSVVIFSDCAETTISQANGSGKKQLARETQRFLRQSFDTIDERRSCCEASVKSSSSSVDSAMDWDWRS